MGRTRGDASKKQGKRPMEAEEDVPEESPSRVRKTSQKGDVGKEKSKQGKGEKGAPSNPTPSSIYKALMEMPFKGTKYPDHELLEELGLLEDVAEIFRNLGSERWFNRSFPSYQEETCQFLSTLKVSTLSAGDVDREKDGFGFIKFRVHNKNYKMGFKKLGEVLGFDEGTGAGSRLDVRKVELERLWYLLGSGTYKTGRVKSKYIRHPGIRYAQKVLAHTFFAKKESVVMTAEEWEMLDAGLKGIIRDVGGYEMRGDATGNSLVQLWVAHAASYQGKAVAKKKDSHHLAIGGMITPILEEVGVTLGVPTADEQYIDSSYLLKGHFLVKEGKILKYKFNVDLDKEATIKLPCMHLTSLRNNANASFTPADEHLEDIETFPMAYWDTTHEPYQAPPVYGSDRYNFVPFESNNQGETSKKAHQHIKLLQRWNKWQDKTIRKLVKTVKVLKTQVKELKAKVEGTSPPRHEEEEQERHEDDEAESTMAGEGRASHDDAPRTSTREARRREKRIMRSPTPQSSNPSYSMDSYSSSSSLQF